MYTIRTELGTLFQDPKTKKYAFAEVPPLCSKTQFSFVAAIDIVVKEAANCMSIHITKKFVPKLTNRRAF